MSARLDGLPIGASDLYRGLSELLCEQGDLAAAAEYLATAQKVGELTELTGWPHRLGVAQARLKEAQGDLEAALALLDEAERLSIREALPDVRPIAALKARVWIRQGRWREADRWANEQGLFPDDELSYLREFEHVTLAEAMLARARQVADRSALRDVDRFLTRLLDSATAGGRDATVIEVLVLQALTAHASDDENAALALLDKAVELAELEGQARVFERLGEFAPLLGTPETVDQSGLAALLSARELEVLHLLGTELDGPEIAQRLFVSLNTLRTHTKHIYAKLGVNSRRTAVRRAEELNLL